MTQALIEKLEALRRFSLCRFGTSSAMIEHPQGSYVNIEDLRAIIEQHKVEKQDAETHNGYIEGTAERLRLICSKLGIAAPVSNEEIMFCQFSLLGAIRRKIDAIYTAPQPDIVAELVKALEKLTVDHQRVKEIMLQEAGIGLIDQTALAEAIDAIARAKAMTE